MIKCDFQEKYPILVREFSKEDISIQKLNELCSFFTGKIEKHPVAVSLGVFDHFEHTNNIKDGEVNKSILGAKNIMFCFGKKLLDPKVLSVRPRSIGVCETHTHFVISYLEAPNPALTETMNSWVDEFEREYNIKEITA